MTTTAMPLSQGDEAILRSWLGGNRPKDIAKARRLDVSEVERVISETCGFDRETARRLLRDGTRAQLPEPVSPAEREAKRPAPDPTPEPLERWSAWRCPACRHLGQPDDHTDCDTQLQPVALLVVPREAA